MTVYSEIRNRKGKRYKYYYYLFHHNGRVVKGTAKGLAHLRGEVVKAEQIAREKAGKGVRQTRTPTLREYIDNHYMPWSKLNKASWETDEIIVEHIKKHFGNERLSDISPKRIKDFVQWRKSVKTQYKRDRANATINREKSVLSKILALAAEDELIDVNPALRVKPLKKPASRLLYWTVAEEKRVMDWLVGERAHLAPIITTFLYTGMRQKELFQLTVDRLDFENNVIHVRGYKTGGERIIAMEPNVRRVLREATIGRKGSELVFRSCKTGLAVTTIKKGLAYACNKAGVRNIGVHGLRHTRGTRLAMAGMNAFQIAAELGHSDVRMSQSYVHIKEASGRSTPLKVVERRSA